MPKDLSMDDEITRLGHEATYILETEAFKKVLSELDEGLIEMWAEGKFTTPEAREEAFARVRGARMFKDRLRALLEGMKVSQDRAKRLQRARVAQGTELEDDDVL